MAGKIDMGGCVSYGWEKFKANPAYHIVGFLLMGVVGGLTMGILSGPLAVGYMKGMIKEENGAKAEIGDVFSAMDTFVPSLIASLLLGVAAGIGGIVVVGGLFVIPMMPLTYYAIAKGEKDAIAAIKQAWGYYQPELISAVLTSFVLALVGGVGYLACGVGALATFPIALIGGYRMTLMMTGEAKANLKAA